MATTVNATVMQTPEPDRLEVLDQVVIVVEDDGVISAMHSAGSAEADQAIGSGTGHVALDDGKVLLPGLVDLHVHAPQWPQLGTGLDLPLERWLFEYTFPLEARYADLDYARTVWADLVATLLAHGTTTAVYFVTIHLEATTALAVACLDAGQRAFVGRVAMDHPEGTPDWYRDADAGTGVDLSASSIEAIAAMGGRTGLVRPIITPRFTPACTDQLLEGLGELAAATNVPVQTHCSESDWQHGYALDRFGVSDAHVLDRFGLLRNQTVLAHSDHVSNDDLDVISARSAGIAHCPLSNSYFGNAVFPARRALDVGVAVGLGTDIAGGAAAGVLSQCHHAVTVSRMLEDGVDAARPAGDRGVAGSSIDAVTAFWMATVGGAAALDLPVGLFEVGRCFDAIAVDTTRERSPLRIWPDLDGPERIFEKIVRLTGPDDIVHTWVAGRLVA
jgi:guanine deaminase